ncbi:MAG: DUF1501 domain-containing protein [Verrucomicrobiales bacterium]
MLPALQDFLNRRVFLKGVASSVGSLALSSLMTPRLFGEAPLLPGGHFRARAKRVIYLHQSGGPSHVDLFDYKPAMQQHHGRELPPSVRMGQRITGMTSGQKAFPVVASQWKFEPRGRCGMPLSELLPHHGKIADDICLIRTVKTDAINHDPAITFIQTGSEQPGRPCFGSWCSYGLGSLNANLPAFVVLISQGSGNKTDQPLFSRLWGSGFLPSSHQGVKFRGQGDPVLYLQNPAGLDHQARREQLDVITAINRKTHEALGDPEIATRIEQYEMAYRMQMSVPELTDITSEPQHVLDLYGPEVSTRGSYAYNCLLARRMSERGVRFVQLYHRGWDQHNALRDHLPKQCRDVDQPSAGLVQDLKQRGLLEDTLVIFGGEFGRTAYVQGDINKDGFGRDHHGRCFSLWVAGGGFKGGFAYGETDDFCYNVVKNPVAVHDFNATLLCSLGVDHERLIFRFQGRDYRLTDVHGHAVMDLLA